MSTLIVQCPTCQTDVIWSKTAQHRPFCCEKCKLIDLGAWANDEYTFEATPSSQQEDHH